MNFYITDIDPPIDFSVQIVYNCFKIKETPCLTTGWGSKEVQDFAVGTAHGNVRYKARSWISFLSLTEQEEQEHATDQ